MRAADELELPGGMLVANPLPESAQLDPAVHDRLLGEALAAADAASVRGKDITPFLLDHLHRHTDGTSVKVNLEIVRGNCRTGVRRSRGPGPRAGRRPYLRAGVTTDPRVMADPVGGGRIYERAMRPALADCSPSGRLRLDAIDGSCRTSRTRTSRRGTQSAAVWIVRRTRIRVRAFPRFAQAVMVQTFCSGIGRMWAERRTTLRRQDGVAEVDAAALWVHLDPIGRQPVPLADGSRDRTLRRDGRRATGQGTAPSPASRPRCGPSQLDVPTD